MKRRSPRSRRPLPARRSQSTPQYGWYLYIIVPCPFEQPHYIATCLAGDFVASDFNNALKTGYDPVDGCWPQWLQNEMAIGDRFPAVVAPGTPIGKVCPAAAGETGLPIGLPIVGGTTDGVAACLASGLQAPGQYNTTLGTTLVFKGLSDTIAVVSGGLLYRHKLPGGRWLPGAASNTGTEWIENWFDGTDPARLDAMVV